MTSKEDLVEFFRTTDTDGNGYLTLDELTAVLSKKGYKDKEIKALFMEADVSGDNKVTESEFLGIMGHGPPGFHKAASIRRCFLAFDKNLDGKIDKQELSKVFEELGKCISEEDISRLMEIKDKDETGFLEYEEFIQTVFGIGDQSKK